jgi:signal transduction histidine kinase
VAVAGVLLAFGGLEIGFSSEPTEVSRATLAVAALVATSALAWRRRSPLPSAAIVLGATVVLAFWQTSGLWMALVAVIATYSVAAYSDRVPAVIAGVLWLIAGALSTAQEDNRTVWGFLGNYLFFAAFLVVGPWIAGRAMRRRHARAALLEDRAVAVQRESDHRAQAAVAEERLRIARELHDVVGHALGVIVVQAGAERATLTDAPASTRETLLTIERIGRDALTEMRRLVDLMRRSDETVAFAPQPSLKQLPALIANVRAAGLPVELRTEGQPHPLEPGVDLSAYRIVQEALTNALKHAGPARARVTIHYGATEIELKITDDGRATGVLSDTRSGHGLVGMRERVALHRGSLTTGTHPSGGYAVSVRLPYEAHGDLARSHL